MTSEQKSVPATLKSASDLRGEKHLHELEALLDKLDAQAEIEGLGKDRRAVRSTFRRQQIPVRIDHPGGSVSECRVLTRDLSTGGLSFVHTGYVHVGTRVEVTLRRVEGGASDQILGTVMRCTHLGRTWHTVGVKFDARVVVDLYASPPAGDESRSGTGAGVTAAPPGPLSGRLLHVEQAEMERRLLAHHLRHTGLEVVGAGDIAEAMKLLRAGRFDVTVTDVNFVLRPEDEAAGEAGEGGEKSGAGEGRRGRRSARAVVRALRATGHAGAIGVLTGETSEILLHGLDEAGAAGVLHRPCPAARLIEAVSDWLGGDRDKNNKRPGPLRSDLADQAEFRPALSRYVAGLSKLSAALRQSAEAGRDDDRCRAICQTLRTTAAAHGFAEIAAAADRTLALLQIRAASADTSQDVREALTRLADLCGRASLDEPRARAA